MNHQIEVSIKHSYESTSKNSAPKLKLPMSLFISVFSPIFFSSLINSYFSLKNLLVQRLAKDTTITNLPQKSWPGTCIVVRPRPASNTTNS
jgi:hypothetical protein